MQVSAGSNLGNPAVILDWACETDPNVAIKAGDVGAGAEPGTWISMLAGLCGITAVRLRQKQDGIAGNG